LFEKGAKIIPIRVGDVIDSAILPKKFLELIILKKLKLTDSALKTKTKDFVLVPDSLDVGQLTKYISLNKEHYKDTTLCWCNAEAKTTPRSKSYGWPLPSTQSNSTIDPWS
jgi:hypothetical protein